ncbi:PREDICTED: F-box/LRR-repeat protein At2g29930-like [Camelina sativa]|uniref:F-box/LRR-repeat protein At2g29930-like n=1 Tax=Camelina sativa TaxID=90675 RepID=A0ABM1RP79_CAMSA|nr:PREDICTED: F-box/LRR-repeat protein At2g29930-like [Camelina sativa]
MVDTFVELFNYDVVDLRSLEEARLDLRSWEQLTEVDDSDEDGDTEEDIFGDVNHLVAGISNVKTLHLSSDTLEVFHLCCDTMPVFRNLLTLSFESDKYIGWQVVPLLLNHSPNLETLVIKGLVHQVTDMCGDACACIPRRRTKKKMKMDEGVCCLSTCQVKVLNISGYRGTCRELKQMRHFLANLKCLETVKVGVKVSRRKENDADNKYMRITDALRKLPRVSSNCQIHFF